MHERLMPAVSAAPAGGKRVLLCADDYALHPAVDTAVVALALQGRLSATSCMTTSPRWAEVARLLDAVPALARGLHLNMTEGHGQPAPTLGAVLRGAYARQLRPAEVRAQVTRQLDDFEQVLGVPPDFIDGHQHVHLFPQVRDAMLEITRQMAPQAWVRQCGSVLPRHRRLADPKGLLIDWLSRTFRARAGKLGIATNPAFAGTYAFRANADFARLFPTFLEALPAGGLVMCHPGHVDAELERLDPLTTLREREYAYFCSAAFPEALKAHDLALH